jgi:Tfp pilus assembly protein PilX
VRRNQAEGGYALVLLLGIMATLAILAATAVLVLGNQQQATTADSSRTQAFGYAEAGLDSAVMAVRTHSWPSTNGAFAAADLSAAFDATYVSGSRPPLVVRVYDNQATVNTAITWDQGGPSAPSTPDGKLWVEAQVTYKGKTSRVRTLVGQVNSTGSLSLPEAAIYTDANVVNGTGGSGDVYAIKEDGTPDTSKQVGVMARGNFVGNWSSDLKPPSGASGPTIDVRVNGTVYNPAIYHNTNTYPGVGGVEPLSTVFPQSTVDTLTSQARAGTPTSANAGGTVVDSALLTQLQRTSSQTYNATTDLVVNGNLTLGGGESWFNFRSLYVTGNLTLGGNTHTNTTALYVGGNFTISGPSGISKFGSIYRLHRHEQGAGAAVRGGQLPHPGRAVQSQRRADLRCRQRHDLGQQRPVPLPDPRHSGPDHDLGQRGDRLSHEACPPARPQRQQRLVQEHLAGVEWDVHGAHGQHGRGRHVAGRQWLSDRHHRGDLRRGVRHVRRQHGPLLQPDGHAEPPGDRRDHVHDSGARDVAGAES